MTVDDDELGPTRTADVFRVCRKRPEASGTSAPGPAPTRWTSSRILAIRASRSTRCGARRSSSRRRRRWPRKKASTRTSTGRETTSRSSRRRRSSTRRRCASLSSICSTRPARGRRGSEAARRRGKAAGRRVPVRADRAVRRAEHEATARSLPRAGRPPRLPDLRIGGLGLLRPPRSRPRALPPDEQPRRRARARDHRRAEALAERARLQQDGRERLQLDGARAGASRLRGRHAPLHGRLHEHVRRGDAEGRRRPRIPLPDGRGRVRRRQPGDARGLAHRRPAAVRPADDDRRGDRAAVGEARGNAVSAP